MPNVHGGKREPRGDRVPAHAERGGVPRASRRADDRRGIDRLADGVAPDRTSGGLGFGMKWNMGWMHDTLHYMREDPIHRKYHHDELTFSIWYAFTRTSCCRFRTTKWCYGKGSLIGKMPGDAWQQFANLRLLYGYMWAHPGKKLLFMGGEFGAAARMDARGRASNGGCSQYPEHARRAAAGYPTSTALYRSRARAARARLRRPASNGSTASDSRSAASSRSCASARQRRAGARRRATSRPCRATTTSSACRAPATGASSSTATRRFTAAAAWAISAASRRSAALRRTAGSRSR